MDLHVSNEKLIDGMPPERAMRLLDMSTTHCDDGRHCAAHGNVVHPCCRCGSVFVAEDVGKLITPSMRALFCRLWELGAKGPMGTFVTGPEVRTARKLETLGMVTLTDNGHMSQDGTGRSDGERWWVEID